MNSAYLLGARLTEVFEKYRWCTAIAGEEGCRVEQFPLFRFCDTDGEARNVGPAEVPIVVGCHSRELCSLGLQVLYQSQGEDFCVFFDARTTHKPECIESSETANDAAISAKLGCVMAISRIAHYVAVICRDTVFHFEKQEVERTLNMFAAQLISPNSMVSPDEKARYPMAEAKIDLHEVPGMPGVYDAVAWMRPWLPLDELKKSIPVVIRLPCKINPPAEGNR